MEVCSKCQGAITAVDLAVVQNGVRVHKRCVQLFITARYASTMPCLHCMGKVVVGEAITGDEQADGSKRWVHRRCPGINAGGAPVGSPGPAPRTPAAATPVRGPPAGPSTTALTQALAQELGAAGDVGLALSQQLPFGSADDVLRELEASSERLQAEVQRVQMLLSPSQVGRKRTADEAHLGSPGTSSQRTPSQTLDHIAGPSSQPQPGSQQLPPQGATGIHIQRTMYWPRHRVEVTGQGTFEVKDALKSLGYRFQREPVPMWYKDYSPAVAPAAALVGGWQSVVTVMEAEQARVLEAYKAIALVCAEKELSFVITKDESGPACPECGAPTQIAPTKTDTNGNMGRLRIQCKTSRCTKARGFGWWADEWVV